MNYIGVDIGSTYTKYCVLNRDGRMERLFRETSPIRQKAYFQEKLAELRSVYPECRIVSCGYGRANIPNFKIVSELTALAVGAEDQMPGNPAVLDIGGQDTKIILQNKGKIREFFLNDKCAAGCGMFLHNVLSMLEIPFREVRLEGGATPEIQLSSVCAVFAQSEIVELIAAGVEERQIIEAVLWHILTKAKNLAGKVDSTSLLLSGGLTEIPGIAAMAQTVIGQNIIIPPNAPYLSAIGCARLAQRSE